MEFKCSKILAVSWKGKSYYFTGNVNKSRMNVIISRVIFKRKRMYNYELIEEKSIRIIKKHWINPKEIKKGEKKKGKTGGDNRKQMVRW